MMARHGRVRSFTLAICLARSSWRCSCRSTAILPWAPVVNFWVSTLLRAKTVIPGAGGPRIWCEPGEQDDLGRLQGQEDPEHRNVHLRAPQQHVGVEDGERQQNPAQVLLRRRRVRSEE